MKVIENPKINARELGSFPKLAMIAGIVAAIICVLIAVAKPDLFYRSYLIGYMYWLNIAVGSLFLLMVQHLTGGHWGVVARRVFEASTSTIKWMLLLFIPVAIALLLDSRASGFSTDSHGHRVYHLFEWADAAKVNGDPILLQKKPYLNPTFFIIRAFIYFGLWSLIAGLLTKWSAEQDRTANPLIPGRMRYLSGPGIVVFFLTMTTAGIDWIMALEPHYYSTMFGPLVMIGQVLAAMAFTISILVLLMSIPPMSKVMTPGHFHDLGKLMFAFTMFWAYINFSQFLITWAANLTEEIPWYLKRMSGGWQWIAGGLILFHFIIPFSILLSRDLKRKPKALVLVALWILFIRFVDLSFLILPSADHGYKGHFDPLAMLVALIAVIAVGGIWLTLFLRHLGSRPMIPVNDPYLQEALDFRGGH